MHCSLHLQAAIQHDGMLDCDVHGARSPPHWRRKALQLPYHLTFRDCKDALYVYFNVAVLDAQMAHHELYPCAHLRAADGSLGFLKGGQGWRRQTYTRLDAGTRRAGPGRGSPVSGHVDDSTTHPKRPAKNRVAELGRVEDI